MAKIWEPNSWYNFWRRYVDLCTRTSFSSVKISGLENLPRDGAVMIAPNHSAALMDALLVLCLKKTPIGFGARSDIFKNPKVASFLRWARILPLARERNGLREVAKNYDTFDEIVDCLDHDVPFCMFSEGTHRAERGMLPVKKGIFKVSKMACDKLGKPVHIVPAGISYEYFFHELGKVTVRLGKPFEIGEFFRRNEGRSEAEIYHLLCEELRERDLELMQPVPQGRIHGKILLRSIAALISLPVFLCFAICSFPIWLPSEIISGRFKDKAWRHTVYFACRFFFPLFWVFHWVYALLLNFYRNLWEDMTRNGGKAGATSLS